MLESLPSQFSISLAENAINARIREALRGQSISHNELKAVRYAYYYLKLLKREVEREKHRVSPRHPRAA